MKSSASSATRRNSNSNHPPLARNAQGHPIAMPDGAASWSIKRETRGRPKVIKGPDGHPYRLPLDATEEDIRDNFGPGTYRLDALDALGNGLDYVTTVEVAADASDDEDDDDDHDDTNGSSDLRYALQTIMQMAKAQSDSIRAVTEAQADWVKGLATARSLPRNAVYLPPASKPTEDRDDDDDDDDDDGDDGGGRNAEPPPSAPAPPTWMTEVARNVGFAVAPAVESFVSKLVKKYGGSTAEAGAASPSPATPPAPTPPAATTVRNPMIQLAEINAGLGEVEREFLGVVLRSRAGEAMTAELLAHSVDEAIALVVESVADVRSERAQARPRGETRPVTPRPDAATGDGFMSRVLAVAARLDPAERATVLALLPRVAPERVEALKAQLLTMTTEEAAAWVREHLPALCVEVES